MYKNINLGKEHLCIKKIKDTSFHSMPFEAVLDWMIFTEVTPTGAKLPVDQQWDWCCFTPVTQGSSKRAENSAAFLWRQALHVTDLLFWAALIGILCCLLCSSTVQPSHRSCAWARPGVVWGPSRTCQTQWAGICWWETRFRFQCCYLSAWPELCGLGCTEYWKELPLKTFWSNSQYCCKLPVLFNSSKMRLQTEQAQAAPKGTWNWYGTMF